MKKKRFVPKGLSDMSWLDSTIKEVDREAKKLERQESRRSPKEKKLLTDLKAVELYKAAKQYVYAKEWKKATEYFQQFAKNYRSSAYLAESLYWLGYSQHKLSASVEDLERQIKMQQQALESLNTLINYHKQSSWVDDALHLRIALAKELYEKGLYEYKNYINGSVRAEKEEDPELEMKLIALNALMSMDQDEAFPILAKIVMEDENPKMRKRAMMILLRSKHPNALPLFIELATKDPDEKVREMATIYLGQRKEKEGLDTLFEIYAKTDNQKIKHYIITSIAQNPSKRAQDKLLDIIKNDKDKESRERAISGVIETVGKKISG